jgi:NADH-ubiquinone oxidoreductase chain 1
MFILSRVYYSFICCSTLGVYILIIAGRSSNSNYSLLGGGLHAIAKTSSYEVGLNLI